MPMTTDEPVHAEGHCYCEGIRFAVDVPAGQGPLFNMYCHCNNCRRSHAAPLYHAVCIEEGWFSFLEGAELLEEFQKPNGPVRAFCRTCGTKILNRFPGWTPGGKVPLVFFPDTLNKELRADLPAVLRAEKNVNQESTVLEQEVLEKHFAWRLEHS
ncbi:MAG: GFA family protein [Deltaproteobacteria bacterium]|nr:GFA family protein [Deltaproteobacteria bacterium]